MLVFHSENNKYKQQENPEINSMFIANEMLATLQTFLYLRGIVLWYIRL